MARGGVSKPFVHYKGTSDDFIVYIDSEEDYKKWKEDSSTPLAQVVAAFKIFQTNKHGTQGELNEASHAGLDNEFGTHSEEECLKIILTKGSIQESTFPERNGPRNDSNGEFFMTRNER